MSSVFQWKSGWRVRWTEVLSYGLRCAIALAALALGQGAVMATTIPTPPVISVDVSYHQVPTFKVTNNSSSPHFFGAAIEFRSALFGTGDVYFGFIQPSSGKVFTWVGGIGGPTIKEGFNPIARGIAMNGGVFTTTSALGASIEYTFTSADTPGMYTIFALLVRSGENPSDPRNWIGVTMVPLIL